MTTIQARTAPPGRVPLPPARPSRPGSRWPAELAVRQRRSDDAAGLLALFGQDGIQRQGWTMDPLTSDATLGPTTPDVFEIVGTLGDATVGYAAVAPMAGRQRHTGTIALCVDEAHQRRGIGGALLTCLVATASAMIGLTRLQLTVFVDNERAIALYRRFGFVTEGRITNFAERGDGFVDAYLMALLAPAR